MRLAAMDKDMECGKEQHGWDAFYLTCDLGDNSGPLAAVLNPSSVKKYALLFKLLWKLGVARFQLTTSWPVG